MTERRYLSRYTRPTFGVEIYRGGSPSAPDAGVTASLYSYTDDGVREALPEWERAATPDVTKPGVYAVTLTSAETSVIGDYEIVFNWEIDGQEEIYGYDVEVGPIAHDYDALNPQWQSVIDQVWMRFADLFDSPYGGPNLQVYAQTNFGRNRIAQLLPVALGRLNTATLGHATYEPNGENFPFAQWGGLLVQALYIEVLKHLIRSYTEQPEILLGTSVSRVDRKDYMQRWEGVLNMELREFERDLGRFRMSQMGLGNVSVLVSGGAYGKLGPFVNSGGAGLAAARGYFVVRRSF